MQAVFMWSLAWVQGHGIDSVVDFTNLNISKKLLEVGLFDASNAMVLLSHDGNDYVLHPRLWSEKDLAVGLPIVGRARTKGKSLQSLTGIWMHNVGVGNIGHVRRIIKELLNVAFTPSKIESAIRFIGDHQEEYEIRGPGFLKVFLESKGSAFKKETKDGRPQPRARLRNLNEPN
jgi:hypothetical protein